MNCQNLENTENANLGIESIAFDEKVQPDVRGIITHDKYQVVVANGNETPRIDALNGSKSLEATLAAAGAAASGKQIKLEQEAG